MPDVTGTRIADRDRTHSRNDVAPGSYWRAVYPDGRLWAWLIVTPNGLRGNLMRHEVEEHEDGTITVSPSILVSRGDGSAEYHGWLRRGVWSDA
jgi:hypothetical protein